MSPNAAPGGPDERLADLLQSVEAIVWRASETSLQFTYVSPEAERLLGYPVEQWFSPDFWREHIHPQDRDWAVEFCRQAVTERRSHRFDYRMIAADGHFVWLRDLVRVIELPGGGRELVGLMTDITEQKRAELALRESEERYRDLVEHSHALLCTHDLSGRLLSVNRSPAAVLGYERERLVGRNFRDLLAPGHEEEFDAYMDRILRNGYDEGIVAVRTRHGEVLYWQYHNTLRRDTAREPIVRGVAFDVTARKKAESVLRSSEAQLRSIFDFAPIGVYRSSREGRLLWANHLFARIYGYESADEVLRISSILELYQNPRDREDFLGWVEREGGSAAGYECRGRRRDGAPVWVELSARRVLDKNGSTAFYEGFVSDITRRKSAEEEQEALQEMIRHAATEWRVTFDAIESPILVLDNGGKIRRLNRSAQRLLSVPFDEIIGTAVEDLAGPFSQACFRLAREVGGAGQPAGTKVEDPESRRVWNVSAIPAPRLEEERGRILVVASDVTEIVRLQETVARAEKMSAMGAIVAGVAHEVRNPLFAISATLDAFDLRYGERADYRKYTAVLREQTDRMNRLMQDLLDYGKPVHFDFRIGSIGPVLEEAESECREIARDREVRIQTCLGPGTLEGLFDRGRLTRVFVNLIENAIQHSPSGAQVRVSAELQDSGEQAAVLVRVEDRGPGLPETDLPQVFEPFFSRRRGGTGLGLSIVRRIVEEHGGSVEIVNRSDGGAAALVRLPLRKAAEVSHA